MHKVGIIGIYATFYSDKEVTSSGAQLDDHWIKGLIRILLS